MTNPVIEEMTERRYIFIEKIMNWREKEYGEKLSIEEIEQLIDNGYFSREY